jgi:nucleoside-diphosphate-sugar epimerase
MSKPIALITGGTGSVGPALVQSLTAVGYRVRLFSRTAPSDPLPNDAEFISGDITDAWAVADALKGVQVVFHLAALLHIPNPSPSLHNRYQQINVEGTRIVAEQASKAHVQKFIYFSTVKVYGTRKNIGITENFTPQPDTIYARTKLAGEQAALSIEGLEATILRLSAVYGPRLKGSWRRLSQAISKGWFIPIGNLQNRHSLTFVDDVARAALLVAANDGAPYRVYNVVGHESPTIEEILSAIYAANGRQLPALRLPRSLAVSGVEILERVSRLFGKQAPLSREAVRQLIEDEVYDGSRLRKLGFDPSVTLEEGWKRSG